MLGQPLFIAGNETPPPPAPVVNASPVLSLAVDSVSCAQEYEGNIVWSTTNPDNLNYKCALVDALDHPTVYEDDIGMSGALQFGLNQYGGGAGSITFRLAVVCIRRSTDIEQNYQDANTITRSNIGPPC